MRDRRSFSLRESRCVWRSTSLITLVRSLFVLVAIKSDSYPWKIEVANGVFFSELNDTILTLPAKRRSRERLPRDSWEDSLTYGENTPFNPAALAAGN
jgi:hypothetical protein